MPEECVREDTWEPYLLIGKGYSTSPGNSPPIAPLNQGNKHTQHGAPDDEGILPKGPYPPWLRMADRAP